MEAEDIQTAIAISLSAEQQNQDGSVARRLFEDAPTDPATDVREATQPQSTIDHEDTTHADQAQALNKLTEIVANCQAIGQHFVDPEFRPVAESLYANGKCRKRDAERLACVQHYGTANLEQVEWRSAGEILQRPDDLQMEFASQSEMLATVQQFARVVEWRVFQSDPAPTDISQGGLGNCWFCGSLAAVAEKPNLVRRAFVDSHSSAGELSPQGVYLLRVCDGGRWRFVFIDGLLPCNRHNMLAFSGARRNQLWVPLLEKAYAKLRGHYEAIEGGTPAEGLRLFTGWPSIAQELQVTQQQRENATQVDPQEALQTQALCPYAGEDVLWTRIESAYASRLIMCGSCGHVDGITDEQYRGVGLSPSHCYSIVQAATAQQGRLRLLKLRNPWGTGRKWTGRFSDKDTENWTEAIKQEIGVTDLGAEGVFWMTLEDIRKYFTSITICPYQENWAEVRRLAVFPRTAVSGQQPAFILESSAAADALLSLMQPEERASLSMMTADFGLAVFRLPQSFSQPGRREIQSVSNFTLVTSVKRRVQDTLICDCFLGEAAKEGPVLVVPLSLNQRSTSSGEGGNDKEFTFACFSPRPLVIKSVFLSGEAHRDAVVAHIRRVGSRKQVFNGVSIYQANDSGLSVFVENTTTNFLLMEAHLTNVFNMTVSRGMEATAQGDQSLDSTDCIPPMHGMLIFVAAAMPSGHNYSFRSSCSISTDGSGDIHVPGIANGDTLHTPFFLEGKSATTAFAARGW